MGMLRKREMTTEVDKPQDEQGKRSERGTQASFRISERRDGGKTQKESDDQAQTDARAVLVWERPLLSPRLHKRAQPERRPSCISDPCDAACTELFCDSLRAARRVACISLTCANYARPTWAAHKRNNERPACRQRGWLMATGPLAGGPFFRAPRRKGRWKLRANAPAPHGEAAAALEVTTVQQVVGCRAAADGCALCVCVC